MSELEDEILSLDGVRGAQVETIEGAPVSVRLDLVEGADPAAVAGLVQGVLRRHGLRSRRQGAVLAPEEPAEPVEVTVRAEDDVVEPTPEPPMPQSSTPEPATPEPAAVPVAEPLPTAGPIDAVTLRQTRTGVEVGVDAGGRRAVRLVVAHPDEVDRAIVSAVAEVIGTVTPRLVETIRQDVGGRGAVTVVLDTGFDDLAVGTVYVSGSTELAVARAVWAALLG